MDPLGDIEVSSRAPAIRRCSHQCHKLFLELISTLEGGLHTPVTTKYEESLANLKFMEREKTLARESTTVTKFSFQSIRITLMNTLSLEMSDQQIANSRWT